MRLPRPLSPLPKGGAALATDADKKAQEKRSLETADGPRSGAYDSGRDDRVNTVRERKPRPLPMESGRLYGAAALARERNETRAGHRRL